MSRVHIELPERFTFMTRIPIRITDINYGGHLGNDAMLSILHEARMQYLASLGCTELDAAGAGLIMADAALIYKGEGFYGDILQVEVAACEITSRSFDLFYRVSCQRTEKTIAVAEAKTGMRCFDYQARKLVSLPAALKEKLSGSIE